VTLLQGFWDTSAVVPLIFREIHTPRAQATYDQAESFFAWDWLQVEVEAALARRQAQIKNWQTWEQIRPLFQWIHIPSPEWAEIRKQNRSWHLRAADAAHLYAFTRLASIRPSLQLVTFDQEQLALARRKHWTLAS